MTTIRPIPTTPALTLDLTLAVPDGVTCAAVEERLRRWPDLEDVGLRAFSHQPIGRRLTWRLTFRHPSRTLRMDEVQASREWVLSQLAAELGVSP
jgi:phenylalanyl-tRNA synthetase beta subunit